MVRVPPEISFERLLGQADVDPASNPLGDLPGQDVDRLIRRCAAALKSHDNDFNRGMDKENALAAFESTMVLLIEVRDLHPSHRADIDAVLARFGYPVPDH